MAPRLMGIPADGSPEFVMAILDGFGTPEDRAREIYGETFHLYTQRLAGYRVVAR